MFNCKSFFLFLVFIAVSFRLSAEQPNILFIFTDDHSHRAVGCYPESPDWVKTPNIDSLADNGIRFANCYMGSWCMGARATLLTGYQTYGIKSMRMEGKYPGSVYDSKKSPFWPAVFRKNGYQTAQVGKWHTGTDNGYGRDWDFQKVWNRPAFPENSGNYFKEQLIQTNGKKAVMTQGYSTDNYTKWAEEYIRGGHGKKKDKPFYLWVCYGAVHGPFTPAPRHLEEYPEVKVKVPADIYPPRVGKPKYSREKEQWVKGENGLPVLKNKRFSGRTVTGKFIHGTDLHSLERQYHQGVLAIDEGVGKLIKALKDTGRVAEKSMQINNAQSFAVKLFGGTIQQLPQQYEAADAHLHIDKDTPPILFQYGGAEDSSEIQPTVEKLEKLEIPVEVLTHYKDGKHGCWNNHPWFMPMMEDIDAWFQEHL